jgi:hypothetical protein
MQDCLENKEPTSGETESVAVCEEAPKEYVSLKTVGKLKERHGKRDPAVRRLSHPKKRTQRNVAFRKKLAIACRGMTHRAGVARRKVRGPKGPTEKRTRDNNARETLKKPEVRKELVQETGRRALQLQAC